MKAPLYTPELQNSMDFIRKKTRSRPAIAVVLGSGLGEFADSLESKVKISTSAIPHYPRSTVEGHHGTLVFGKLQRVPVVAFQGRVHYYETGSLESVLYPIRIAHALGVQCMIFTNAAGGLNPLFSPGDLMLIDDQINLTFTNPILALGKRAHNRDLYDHRLKELITTTAFRAKIPIRRGVYCGLKGPSYETAAEVGMAQRIGADAVGMSTVNEASLATSLGMIIAGISCITNLATGIGTGKLSHGEVTEVANSVKHSFSTLLHDSLLEIYRSALR